MTAAPPPDGVVIRALPNVLKQKVGTGPASLPRRAAVDFAASVQDIAAAYGVHLRGLVEELYRGVTDVPTLYAICHQIRGEAGSYGYGPVGAIADALCRFIDSMPADDPRRGSIAGLYINALRLVLAAGDSEGQGKADADTRLLLQHLNQMARHMTGAER